VKPEPKHCPSCYARRRREWQRRAMDDNDRRESEILREDRERDRAVLGDVG
jgi:hypothetical protein